MAWTLDDKREFDRAWRRRCRERRVAAGLCVDCGQPRGLQPFRCAGCFGRQRRYDQTYRERRRWRHLRKVLDAAEKAQRYRAWLAQRSA